MNVVIPDPIPLRVNQNSVHKFGEGPSQGQFALITFQIFMDQIVLAHASWGQGTESLYLLKDLKKQIEGLKPGMTLALTPPVYERIIQIIRTTNYNPHLGIHLLPFVEAFEAAGNQNIVPLAARR